MTASKYRSFQLKAACRPPPRPAPPAPSSLTGASCARFSRPKDTARRNPFKRAQETIREAFPRGLLQEVAVKDSRRHQGFPFRIPFHKAYYSRARVCYHIHEDTRPCKDTRKFRCQHFGASVRTQRVRLNHTYIQIPARVEQSN